jgi:hypothetical protein
VVDATGLEPVTSPCKAPISAIILNNIKSQKFNL